MKQKRTTHGRASRGSSAKARRERDRATIDRLRDRLAAARREASRVLGAKKLLEDVRLECVRRWAHLEARVEDGNSLITIKQAKREELVWVARTIQAAIGGDAVPTTTPPSCRPQSLVSPVNP